MDADFQFKVCGMTRIEDTVAAVEAGASYLGFIFYPKSPRGISLDHFNEMYSELPDVKKVAVLVNPEPGDLELYLENGLDRLQVHFPVNTESQRIETLSKVAGKDRLWLAPKIAPDEEFDPKLLDYADTILLDAYKKDAFGGTGHTGNWNLFRDLKDRFTETQWILAGGLGPDNLLSALEETGTNFVDLNSGLEISPGIKDREKIAAVRRIIEKRS